MINKYWMEVHLPKNTFISLSTKEATLSNSLPHDLQHDIVILTCLLVPLQSRL